MDLSVDIRDVPPEEALHIEDVWVGSFLNDKKIVIVQPLFQRKPFFLKKNLHSK